MLFDLIDQVKAEEIKDGVQDLETILMPNLRSASDKECLAFFDSIVEKIPFLSYCLCVKLNQKTAREYTSAYNVFINCCKNAEAIITEENFSDLLVLFLVLEFDTAKLWPIYLECPDKPLKIKEALNKVDYLYNSIDNSEEDHIKRLFRLTYDMVFNNVSNDGIISLINKKYEVLIRKDEGLIRKDDSALIEMLRPDLDKLIIKMIRKGESTSTHNVLGVFPIDLSAIKNDGVVEVDLEQELLNSLRCCDDRYFFRGMLLYWEYIKTSKGDLDKCSLLKHWYANVLDTKTPVAIEESGGIRLLYMCWAFSFAEITDNKSLKEKLEIDLNTPFSIKVDMQRKQYKREYRRAVHWLLYNNMSLCKSFIYSTSVINPDKYSKDVIIPRRVSEMGEYDTERLLEVLCGCNLPASDVVYIYMNTFLRGVVNFDDFIARIYLKKSKKKYYESLKEYDMDGRMECRESEPDNVRKFIVYFKPFPILLKEGCQMLLDEKSRTIVRLHPEKIYQTSFLRYNPNRRILKVELSGDDKKRNDECIDRQLSELICNLNSYSGEADISENLVKASKNIKILWIERSNPLISELCIAEAEAMLACPDPSKMMEILNDANYFSDSFKDDDNDKIDMTPEQFAHIRGIWKRLCQKDCSKNDKFKIYKNTIIKKTCSLSEFVDTIVCKKNAKNFFRDEVGTLYGKLPKTKSNEDDNRNFISTEFHNKRRIYNKKDIATGDIIDMFSVLNTSEYETMAERGIVKYEIKEYYGKGRFGVEIKPFN